MSISTTFRPICPPALFRCLSNSGTHTELRTTSFIESMGVGSKHASVNRRDLQNMIFDLVKTGIDIRFSSRIDSLREEEEYVEVTYNNGVTEKFDLLIGADGLHSGVRKLRFENESEFTRYLGYYVSAFRVKGVSGKQPGQMNILRKPNKQAGILDLGDGDSLALFVYGSDKEEYIPRNRRKEVLSDVFSDMAGPVPSILRGIGPDTSIYLDTTTQIVMPKWHTGRVVLIGDAAYCLTLVSGQGASLAMGGAYVLAKAIEKNPNSNLGQALAEYDQRLRAFVEELQLKSKKFAGQFIPASRFGLWITNKMVALTKNPLVKKQVGKLFSIQSLFEREKNQP